MGEDPVARSRTSLFLSFRESAARWPAAQGASSLAVADEERHGLLGPDGDDLERGTASRLPPPWVDSSEQAGDALERLEGRLGHLERLQAKRVLPGFRDRTAEEHAIKELSNEITADIRGVQRSIQRISEQAAQLLQHRRGEIARSDLVMAANVQTGLATRVQLLSARFRKMQASYLRQLRGHERRPTSPALDGSSGALPSGARSPALIEADPMMSLAEDEQYASMQVQSMASPSLSSVDKRSQDIEQIATSITDLSTLFKDLSSLVIDQGTLLDRIDYNVEQMSVEIKASVEHLRRATDHQRRSGKYCTILLLLLIIVAVSILIAYKPRG